MRDALAQLDVKHSSLVVEDVICCCCAQVTVSRSSVSFFPVRRVWILTTLQLLNFLGFAVEAKLHLLPRLGDPGYALLIGWMVWVGLMGGAAYSNCMHLVNTDPDIPEDLRELGTNATFLLVSIAIMGSTLLFIVLDSSLYQMCQGPEPGCVQSL